MIVTELVFIFAMLNICFVSFVWTIKQIILLCHWFYEREIAKLTEDK